MKFTEHLLCARGCFSSCLTDEIKDEGDDNSDGEKEKQGNDGDDDNDVGDGDNHRGQHSGGFFLRGAPQFISGCGGVRAGMAEVLRAFSASGNPLREVDLGGTKGNKCGILGHELSISMLCISHKDFSPVT